MKLLILAGILVLAACGRPEVSPPTEPPTMVEDQTQSTLPPEIESYHRWAECHLRNVEGRQKAENPYAFEGEECLSLLHPSISEPSESDKRCLEALAGLRPRPIFACVVSDDGFVYAR